MDDVYEMFDDLIEDIMTNEKFQAINKELFIRCIILNISLLFITQSDFFVPKDVTLDSSHYLIMNINNKRELENIAKSHSADFYYKDFVKIYKEYTKETFGFLTIDTTLPTSDLLRFRENFLIPL